MHKELKYPVGCFIEWCDEYYKVLSNYSDRSGKVVDMGGDVDTNFYFNYGNEPATVITDTSKIKELENCLFKLQTN